MHHHNLNLLLQFLSPKTYFNLQRSERTSKPLQKARSANWHPRFVFSAYGKECDNQQIQRQLKGLSHCVDELEFDDRKRDSSRNCKKAKASQ